MVSDRAYLHRRLEAETRLAAGAANPAVAAIHRRLADEYRARLSAFDAAGAVPIAAPATL